MTKWSIMLLFFIHLIFVSSITKVGEKVGAYRMVTGISRDRCWKVGGCELELYGFGFLFNSWYGENQVYFDEYKAEVIRYKSNGNKLTVKTPEFSSYDGVVYRYISVIVMDINTNSELIWLHDSQRRFRFDAPYQSMPVPYVAEALDTTHLIYQYAFYNGLDDVEEIRFRSDTLTAKYPGAEGLQCDYVSNEINMNYYLIETEEREYEDKTQQFGSNRILCQPPSNFSAGHYLIKTRSIYGYTLPVFESLNANTFYAEEHGKIIEYNYEVYPVIEDIQPRVLGTLGGGEVVITGSGFDSIAEYNNVKINDMDCVVKEATSTRIVCTVPAQADVNTTTQSYRGLSVKNSGCIPIITNETLDLVDPDLQIWFKDQGTDGRFSLTEKTACNEIYQQDVYVTIANRMFRHYNSGILFDFADHLKVAYRWWTNPDDPDSKCWLREFDDLHPWHTHHDDRMVSQSWRGRFCDKNTGTSRVWADVKSFSLDFDVHYDFIGYVNKTDQGWYDHDAPIRVFRSIVRSALCVALCDDFQECKAVNYARFTCYLYHETSDSCPSCWKPLSQSPFYSEHFEKIESKSVAYTGPTCGGTSAGASCEFPFYHKGVEYTSCTSVDLGRPWCRTWDAGYYVDDREKIQSWGFCDCFHELTYQVNFLTTISSPVTITLVGENGSEYSKTLTPSSSYNFIAGSGIAKVTTVKASFAEDINQAHLIQLYNEITFEAQTYESPASATANTDVVLSVKAFEHNSQTTDDCRMDYGPCDWNIDSNSVQGPNTITSAEECLAWCQTQSGWDACDFRSPECYTHIGVNIESNNPGWYPHADLMEDKCWLKRKCTSDLFLMKEVSQQSDLVWIFPNMNELAPILNEDFRIKIHVTIDPLATRSLDFWIQDRPSSPMNNGGFGCYDSYRHTYSQIDCRMADGQHQWRFDFRVPAATYIEPRTVERTFYIRRTPHGRLISVFEDGIFYGSNLAAGVTNDLFMYIWDIKWEFQHFLGTVHQVGVEPIEPVVILSQDVYERYDVLWTDSQAYQYDWSDNSTWLNETHNAEGGWWHGPFDTNSFTSDNGGGEVSIALELDTSLYTHFELEFRLWFIDSIDRWEEIFVRFNNTVVWERHRNGHYTFIPYNGSATIPNARVGDRYGDRLYEDGVVRIPVEFQGQTVVELTIGIDKISSNKNDESWAFNRVKVSGITEYPRPETFSHPDATDSTISIEVFAQDEGLKTTYMRINGEDVYYIDEVDHHNKGTYVSVIDQYSGKVLFQNLRFNPNNMAKFIHHVGEGRIVAITHTDWSNNFCMRDLWSHGEGSREKSCGTGSSTVWGTNDGMTFCEDEPMWSMQNMDQEELIYGVYLVGASGGWISSLKIEYSKDKVNWEWADGGRTFLGGSKVGKYMEIYFDKFVYAKHLRIWPQSYENSPTIRWAIITQCRSDAYHYPFAQIGMPFPHTFSLYRPQVLIGRKGGNENGEYPWIGNDLESLTAEIPIISGGREIFIEFHTAKNWNANSNSWIYYALINANNETYPDLITVDGLPQDSWYNKTYFIPESFGEIVAVHFMTTGTNAWRMDLLYIDGFSFDVGTHIEIDQDSNQWYRVEGTAYRREEPFVQTVSEFFYYTLTNGEESKIETWFVPKATGTWKFSFHVSVASCYLQYAEDSTNERDLVYSDSSTSMSMDVTEGVPSLITVICECNRNDYICFFELNTLTPPESSGLRPIPHPVSLEYFRTPIIPNKNQVLVEVNGMAAFCRDEERCRLEYSDDNAPTITSVTPPIVVAGGEIDIRGSDFDDTTVAYLGGTQMTCTLESSEQLDCIAPSLPGSSYTVEVISRSVGRAVGNAFSISINVEIDSILPSEGSTKGGTIIEIQGAGFGNADEIEITIGGVNCPLYEFTDNYCVTENVCEPKPVISYSALKCVTPPGTGASDVVITLNGVSHGLTNGFTYNSAITPRIDSIVPTSGAPGTLVTISGANFDQMVGELPGGWYIDKFGFQQFYSRVNAFIGDIPCSIQSFTDTEIICQVYRPGLNNLNLAVDVNVWNVGLADNPNSVTFSYLAAITSVDPIEGSFYGGQKVRLTGSGFQPVLENNEIKFGDDLECTPTSVSDTLDWLECETPMYPDLPGKVPSNCYQPLQLSEFQLETGCEESSPIRTRLRVEKCTFAQWNYTLAENPTRTRLRISYISDDAELADHDDYTNFFYNGELIGTIFNNDACHGGCTAQFPIGTESGHIDVKSYSSQDVRDRHMMISSISTECYVPGKYVPSPSGSAGRYTRLRFDSAVSTIQLNGNEILSSSDVPNVCSTANLITECFIAVTLSEGDSLSPLPVSGFDPGYIEHSLFTVGYPPVKLRFQDSEGGAWIDLTKCVHTPATLVRVEYYAEKRNRVWFRVYRIIDDPQEVVLVKEIDVMPDQKGPNTLDWSVTLQPGDCFGHHATKNVLTYNAPIDDNDNSFYNYVRQNDASTSSDEGDTIVFDDDSETRRTYAYQFVYRPTLFDTMDMGATQGQVTLPISVKATIPSLLSDVDLKCDGCSYTYDVYETSTIHGTDCLRNGLKYVGAIEAAEEGSDLLDCRNICLSAELCQAWNFNGTHCEILSSMTDSSSQSGIVSAKKHCNGYYGQSVTFKVTNFVSDGTSVTVGGEPCVIQNVAKGVLTCNVDDSLAHGFHDVVIETSQGRPMKEPIDVNPEFCDYDRLFTICSDITTRNTFDFCSDGPAVNDPFILREMNCCDTVLYKVYCSNAEGCSTPGYLYKCPPGTTSFWSYDASPYEIHFLTDLTQYDSGVKCYPGTYDNSVGWWRYATARTLQQFLNANTPFAVSADGSWGDSDYYSYRYFLKYWGYDVEVTSTDWKSRDREASSQFFRDRGNETLTTNWYFYRHAQMRYWIHYVNAHLCSDQDFDYVVHLSPVVTAISHSDVSLLGGLPIALSGLRLLDETESEVSFADVDRLHEEGCWAMGCNGNDGATCGWCGKHQGQPMICCRRGWANQLGCDGVDYNRQVGGHHCVLRAILDTTTSVELVSGDNVITPLLISTTASQVEFTMPDTNDYGPQDWEVRVFVHNQRAFFDVANTISTSLTATPALYRLENRFANAAVPPTLKIWGEFAASGNSVKIGDSDCPLITESADYIECSPPPQRAQHTNVHVNVPNKGIAQGSTGPYGDPEDFYGFANALAQADTPDSDDVEAACVAIGFDRPCMSREIPPESNCGWSDRTSSIKARTSYGAGCGDEVDPIGVHCCSPMTGKKTTTTLNQYEDLVHPDRLDMWKYFSGTIQTPINDTLIASGGMFQSKFNIKAPFEVELTAKRIDTSGGCFYLRVDETGWGSDRRYVMEIRPGNLRIKMGGIRTHLTSIGISYNEWMTFKMAEDVDGVVRYYFDGVLVGLAHTDSDTKVRDQAFVSFGECSWGRYEVANMSILGNGYSYNVEISDPVDLEFLASPLGNRKIRFQGYGFPATISPLYKVWGEPYDIISSSHTHIEILTRPASPDDELETRHRIGLGWDSKNWILDHIPERGFYRTHNVSSHAESASVAYATTQGQPDILTITGEFYEPEEFTNVYIGDTLCPVISATQTQIECNIPAALYGRFDVVVQLLHGITESLPITLELKIKSKDQAYQSGRFGGTTVTLRGRGFGNSIDGVEVMAAGRALTVQSVTGDSIVAMVEGCNVQDCFTAHPFSVRKTYMDPTNYHIEFQVMGKWGFQILRSGGLLTKKETIETDTGSNSWDGIHVWPFEIATGEVGKHELFATGTFEKESDRLAKYIKSLTKGQVIIVVGYRFHGQIQLEAYEALLHCGASHIFKDIGFDATYTYEGDTGYILVGRCHEWEEGEALSLGLETAYAGDNTDLRSNMNLDFNVGVFWDAWVEEPSVTIEFLEDVDLPVVTRVEPDFSTTGGGALITIFGEEFTSDTEVYLGSTRCATETAQVLEFKGKNLCDYDNVRCDEMSVNATHIQCISNPNEYSEGDVRVRIPEKGYALAENITFLYGDKWSSKRTWGHGWPNKDDWVSIPEGNTVILDYSPPPLGGIIVQGSLIFEDKQDIDLIAGYIIVNGGTLQIGTAEKPFMHKATITLTGDRETSNELPVFGAKVIACWECTLDMHGRPRGFTYTKLEGTVYPGNTSMTLERVDGLEVGDEIFVTATEYWGNELEKRIISNIDGNVVHFDTPLVYKHVGEKLIYPDGDKIVDTRAEVGLLTRNVKIQGDEQTVFQQFGGMIFMHTPGDNSITGRFSNIELERMGQAFGLGRYPLHFHMIGSVSNSYVKNITIHDTFNRALTMHAINHLLIEHVCAVNIRGHAFFVEDGNEYNNTLRYNLGANIQAVGALLVQDLTPTVFWVTNPSQNYIGNIAAGSSHFGWWYQVPEFPTGPSFTTTICPQSTPLGIFENNYVHSTGSHGMFIESLKPTENGYYCQSPGTLKHVTAHFHNFTAWKIQGTGVWIDFLTHFHFHGLTVADMLDFGITIIWSVGVQVPEEFSIIENAYFIDKSNVGFDAISFGIHNDTARSEAAILSSGGTHRTKFVDVSFAHLKPAVSTCNWCKTFKGGYETYFKDVKWYDIEEKVHFKHRQKRGMVKDIDGSFIGDDYLKYGMQMQAGGSVADRNDILFQSGCFRDPLYGNAEVCGGDEKIVRVAFNDLPARMFRNHNDEISIIKGVHTTDVHTGARETFHWGKYQPPRKGVMMHLLSGHTYELEWEMQTYDTTFCPEHMQFGVDNVLPGEGVILKCRQGASTLYPHFFMNAGSWHRHVEVFPEMGFYEGLPLVESYVPGIHNKYYFSKENKMTWDQARGVCLNLNRDLISITSEEIWTEVKDHWWNPEHAIWHGMHGDYETKTYSWIDGTIDTGYEQWVSSDEPNFNGGEQFCGWATGPHDASWDDTQCYNNLNFVCGPVRDWTDFIGTPTEAIAQVGTGIVTSITVHLNADNAIVAIQLTYDAYGAGAIIGDDSLSTTTITESVTNYQIFAGVDIYSSSGSVLGFRLTKVDAKTSAWLNPSTEDGTWIGASTGNDLFSHVSPDGFALQGVNASFTGGILTDIAFVFFYQQGHEYDAPVDFWEENHHDFTFDPLWNGLHWVNKSDNSFYYALTENHNLILELTHCPAGGCHECSFVGWRTVNDEWECPVFMRLPEKDEDHKIWNCISERNENRLLSSNKKDIAISVNGTVQIEDGCILTMNYDYICGLDSHMMICVEEDPFINDTASGFVDEENGVFFTGWSEDDFVTISEEFVVADPDVPLNSADQFGRAVGTYDVKIHGPFRSKLIKTWSYFPTDHRSVKISMRIWVIDTWFENTVQVLVDDTEIWSKEYTTKMGCSEGWQDGSSYTTIDAISVFHKCFIDLTVEIPHGGRMFKLEITSDVKVGGSFYAGLIKIWQDGSPIPERIEGAYLWNDPKAWTHMTNPGVPGLEGDALIPRGYTIVLNETTPILNRLEIYGELIFATPDIMLSNFGIEWVETSIELHAHVIALYGSMLIGTETAYWSNDVTASIVLHGDRYATTPWLDVAQDYIFGNKQMTVFGELKAYGAPRTTQAILSRPITAGTNTLYVQGSVDWVAGEEIFISTTSMHNTENDESVIVSTSYDKITDETLITVEEAFAYYHEATSVHGLEMRARVIMTSRNVKIIGGTDPTYDEITSTIDSQMYGASVQTDRIFFCEAKCYDLHGLVDLRYVEFLYGGKRWEERGYVVDIGEGVQRPGNNIEGCGFKNMYWGAVKATNIQQEDFVTIRNNVVYNYKFDMWFLDGYGGHIFEHNTGMWDSSMECGNPAVADTLCTPEWGSMRSVFKMVPNEIHHTFLAGANSDCYYVRGSTNSSHFTHNTAVSCGRGFFLKTPSSAYSHLTAFSCRETGIHTWDLGGSSLSNIYVGANQINLRLYAKAPGPTVTGYKLENSVIVGMVGDLKCDIRGFVGKDRVGLVLPMKSDINIVGYSFKFHIKLGQHNAFGSQQQWQLDVNNVKFVNFPEKDNCGENMYAIASNKMAQSGNTPLRISGVSFQDVPESARLKFWKWDELPVGKWRDSIHFMSGAQIADGLNHATIEDTDGSLVGTGRATTLYPNHLKWMDWMVDACTADDTDEIVISCPWWIRLNPQIRAIASKPNSQGMLSEDQIANSCTEHTDWQAYLCEGIVDFPFVVRNPDDFDRFGRRVSPAGLIRYTSLQPDENTEIANVDILAGGNSMNSEMVYVPEMSFNTRIQSNSRYLLQFSGTNPKSMNIEFHSNFESGKGVLLDIIYSDPSKLALDLCDVTGANCTAGSELVMEYTETGGLIDHPAGTYVYSRLTRTLTVVLHGNEHDGMNAGVMIKIRTLPVLEVRMGVLMTPQEFYSNKDDFVQNVAAILGVPSDRIVVVSINPGDYESIGRRRRLTDDAIVFVDDPDATSTDVTWHVDPAPTDPPTQSPTLQPSKAPTYTPRGQTPQNYVNVSASTTRHPTKDPSFAPTTDMPSRAPSLPPVETVSGASSSTTTPAQNDMIGNFALYANILEESMAEIGEDLGAETILEEIIEPTIPTLTISTEALDVDNDLSEIQCIEASLPRTENPAGWVQLEFNQGITETLQMPDPFATSLVESLATWKAAFNTLDPVGSVQISFNVTSDSSAVYWKISIMFDSSALPRNYGDLPMITLVDSSFSQDEFEFKVSECRTGVNHEDGVTYEVQRISGCGSGHSGSSLVLTYNNDNTVALPGDAFAGTFYYALRELTAFPNDVLEVFGSVDNNCRHYDVVFYSLPAGFISINEVDTVSNGVSWTAELKTTGSGVRPDFPTSAIDPSIDVEALNGQIWNEWSSWTECTAECLGGVHSRSRSCKMYDDIATCEAQTSLPSTETATCNDYACPTNFPTSEPTVESVTIAGRTCALAELYILSYICDSSPPFNDKEGDSCVDSPPDANYQCTFELKNSQGLGACARCPDTVEFKFDISLSNSEFESNTNRIKNGLSTLLNADYWRISIEALNSRRRHLAASTRVLTQIQTDDQNTMRSTIQGEDFANQLGTSLQDAGVAGAEISNLELTASDTTSTTSPIEDTDDPDIGGTNDGVEGSGAEDGGSKIGIFIGIGVGCVAVLGLILYFVSRKSKNKGGGKTPDDDFDKYKGEPSAVELSKVDLNEIEGNATGENPTEKKIRNLASTMSFTNLLNTLEGEIDSPLSPDLPVADIPSYKRKREIFESVWKDRDGVKFDFGLDYEGNVVVTREKLENILGNHVGGVCLIQYMKAADNGLRVKGKICDQKPNPDRIILDDLVESIESGSLAQTIMQGLRLGNVPILDVFEMDLENISASRKSHNRVPGTQNSTSMFDDDSEYSETASKTCGDTADGDGTTECFVEVEISDERLVNRVIATVKRQGVMPTVSKGSGKIVLLCKGSFLQILKVKESISDMHLEAVQVSKSIRVGKVME